MNRFLVLTHRYLGIGISLILLLWCLSGFVMMYKPYPELSAEQQLETLANLDFTNCCSQLDQSDLASSGYSQFQIHMLNQEPVLLLVSEYGQVSSVNLKSGQQFYGISERQAQAIANEFANQHQYPAPTLKASITNDQWTVYPSYNLHRPLYQFQANDEAGTQWYISSLTGEIVQITTREQRIWGYLGPVIHWLYPTILREKAQLWNQTVIWLSVLGTFLTVTGIYIGLKQYKVRKNGKHSSYRGMALWHHYVGLVFGLLTFTWMLSGLFSMQPWGLFEPSGAAQERLAIQGGTFSLNQLNSTLAQLNELPLNSNPVMINGMNVQGSLFITSMNANLQTNRYRADNLNPSTLTETELYKLANAILAEEGIKEASMLYEEDNYYFSYHTQVSFPVYKVIANNNEQTIYYLSPLDGSISAKYDAANKGFRWFHLGLHRLDFTELFRSRPLRDFFMWFLLSGVTLGVFTGFFLGIKRVYRSF